MPDLLWNRSGALRLRPIYRSDGLDGAQCVKESMRHGASFGCILLPISVAVIAMRTEKRRHESERLRVKGMKHRGEQGGRRRRRAPEPVLVLEDGRMAVLHLTFRLCWARTVEKVHPRWLRGTFVVNQ